MKNSIQLKLLFFFVAINFAGYSHVYRDTIYVNTDGIDAYVSGLSKANYGNDTSVYVKRTAGVTRRTFLDVDLTGIPTNALVTKTELKLYALAVDNSSSHPMFVERVLSSWSETTISGGNQPSVTAAGRSSITHGSTSSTGWHTMDITTLGQYAINYPSLNYGWRIVLQTEAGTSQGVSYASSEHGTSNKRPYVIVEYVLPIQITATVQHCTSGMDDGLIDVSYSGGSGAYSSYEWFHYDMGTVSSIESGTTMSNSDIDNLEDGLYLLTVVDNLGYRGYKYFLVGEYGTSTTVDFRNNTSTTNSQLFNEDALMRYDISSSDGNSWYGNSVEFTAYTSSTSYQASVLKYNVDFDPFFNIETADLRLQCWTHYGSNPGSNAGYVSMVTEDWNESLVTWNSRPAVTTTDRINIPETTGSVVRHDTIDILNFAEYWKENPTENFGLELTLTNYTTAHLAYLKYYSYDNTTAANRPSFLLTFSLPKQIATEYIDSIDAGKIVVTAPNGELPYTYMLSYDTLPDLSDMWNAIKDSTDIDSTYFFQGKSNTQTYTFENLPSNRYFVGIYDNNGDQILMEQVILTPSFEIFDSTNVDVDADTLMVKAGQGSAKATVLARLPYLEDGGIEFEVVQLDDLVRFGFDNVDDVFPVFGNRDYNYSVEIRTTGKVYLTRSDTLIDSTTVSIGDRLALTREQNEIILYKNNIVVGTDPVARFNNKDWKLEIELAGQDAKLKPLLPYGKFKIPKLTFDLKYPECGDTKTTVYLSVPTSSYFGLSFSNFVLKDETDAVVYSGSSLPGSMSLDIGIYTLFYQYTVTSTGLSYSVYIDQIAVGYPIIWTWNTSTDNIEQDWLTLNTIEPINTSQVAKADGLNECENLVSTSNWVQFESKGSAPMVYTKYPPVSWVWGYEEITLKLDNTTVYAKVKIQEISSGLITRYVTLYDGTTPSSSYMTNSLKPFSILFPTDGTSNYDYVELYQDGVLQGDFQTNTTGIITVHAKEFGQVLIQNTIASFCGEDKIQNYADLTKKLDGGYYLSRKGIVKFIYKEEYKDLDDQLTFNVYDSENQQVMSNVVIPEIVVFGDNRYTLDFSCTGINNLVDGVYVLEVINEKNEKWYLRFKVVNNC